MSVFEQLAAATGRATFIDHHVHPPQREHQVTLAEFRRPWTESSNPRTVERSVPDSLAYRMMVRELAALLDVESQGTAVVGARNKLDRATYQRILAEDVNLGICLADDLFQQEQSVPVAEWSAELGRTVRRLVRVEAFIEQRTADCNTLDQAFEALDAELQAKVGSEIVGLKTIIGYRTGFEIQPPNQLLERRARDAYARLREDRRAGRTVRIEQPDLANLLIWRSLELAASYGLPVQFHVALGDEDIVLRQNDPTLLRAIFEEPAFQDVPVVLLHCYPFHRQAGYLASLYPNVYVDLGLTIPLVGPAAPRVLAETLELTPMSQLLASSDGHGLPEFQWFAVRLWRRAIASVFAEYVEAGALSIDESETTAEAILGGTSCFIYSLAV